MKTNLIFCPSLDWPVLSAVHSVTFIMSSHAVAVLKQKIVIIVVTVSQAKGWMTPERVVATASSLNKRSKRGRQRGPTRHCYHSNIEFQSLDQHRARRGGQARDRGREKQREQSRERTGKKERWERKRQERGGYFKSLVTHECWLWKPRQTERQADQCANALSIDLCVTTATQMLPDTHTHTHTRALINTHEYTVFSG